MKTKIAKKELNECFSAAIRRIIREQFEDDDDELEFDPENNQDDLTVDRALNPERYKVQSKNKDPKTGKKKMEVPNELRSARKAGRDSLTTSKNAEKKDDAAIEQSEFDDMGLKAYDTMDYGDEGLTTKDMRGSGLEDSDEISKIPTLKLKKIADTMEKRGLVASNNRVMRDIINELRTREEYFLTVLENGREGAILPYGYVKTEENITYKVSGGETYKGPDIIYGHETKNGGYVQNKWSDDLEDFNIGWGRGKDINDFEW